MVRYLNILLFFLFSFASFGKSNRISWEYNYAHYGIEKGLPSSETYQVYQDRSGMLWILTDRGIVRYDGFGFQKYTIANGLADNVNFRTVEDAHGSMWFVGYNGLLSIYKNGKMQPYRYNHVIRKVALKGRNTNVFIHVNRDGSVVYNLLRKKTFVIDKTGKVTSHLESLDTAVCFYELDEEVLPQTNNVKDYPVDVFLVRNKQRIAIGKLCLRGSARVKKHKGHYFVMSGYRVYLNREKGFFPVSENQDVIALDCDQNFLYIGLYKNGVKKYRFDPGTRKLTFIEHYLPDYSVSSVFTDRNGTLWITTLEKGIYALYDQAFQQLKVNGNKLQEEVRFICGNKQKVVATFHVGKWQQLYPPYLCKDVGKLIERYNLIPYGEGFAFTKGVVDWSDWKDVDDRYIANPIHKTDSSLIGKRMFPIRGIVEMKPGANTFYDISLLMKEDLPTSNEWSHFASEQKLFLLCEEGLYSFSVRSRKLVKPYKPVLQRRLDRLKYDPVWGLFVYSTTEGIFRVNMKTDRATEFIPGMKLGKQISTIFFDEKKRLWIANEEGVYLFVLKNGKPFMRLFLNKNMLSSAEIMDLYAYRDVLYLATKSGVQKIEIRKLKKRKNDNPMKLLAVQAFAKNKELKKSAVYPAKTDLIRIFLSNKYPEGYNEYRYRFSEGGTWVRSNKGEIIINNPSAGDYRLEVSYLNRFNHWTYSERICSFTVEKIIFLRWYFWVLYGILVFVLFYVILKLSIRSVNKKNFMLNRVVELEQMALSAQMNPHFIFNSLNSIHSFLLYDENEHAEKYLIRFAKLIRQTLSNSRVTYITIEEEVETLQNYILLERMRFKDHFDFEIACDLRVLPSYPCIPPMLIQPYVENAIIHGLAKRKEGAKLLVKFYMENEQLKVLIEDNGVGYSESTRNKRDSGHKSYGTQITEERLKSLQSKGKNSFAVSVSNLDDSDPEFPGTRVILVIPIPDH